MARYLPPLQSKLGQILDVVVLLVLIIGALRVPLWFNLAAVPRRRQPSIPPPPGPISARTRRRRLRPIMRWASPIPRTGPNPSITARFDYTIDPLELLVMIVVVIAYYVLVVRFSASNTRKSSPKNSATGDRGNT